VDILNSVLFWIHLVALAVGGAAVFGLPVVGSRVAKATPEMRPVLFGIANQISSMGRAALITLIISGPLLVWLKFGGTEGFTYWFSVKMVLVLILVVLVVYAGINAKRAQGGDMAAAKRAPQLSMIAVVVYLCVIGAAVLNFG
jgi:putative membrane protein